MEKTGGAKSGVSKNRVVKSFFTVLSAEKNKKINTCIFINIEIILYFFSKVGEVWQKNKTFLLSIF